MAELFTRPGAWDGGGYDLSLVYGPGSARLLGAAFAELWEHPALDGPYGDRSREPEDQPKLTMETARDEDYAAAGVATLPDRSRVPCATWTYAGDGSLDFWIPLGSLSEVWPHVGPYPFLDEDETEDVAAWQEPLDGWLADVACSVFARAPYRYGAIGFELGGLSSDVRRRRRWATNGPPRRRGETFIRVENARPIVYPATDRGGWTLVSDGTGKPSTWRELFGHIV